MPDDGSAEIALFDVDGTLVDTNYHHALAWYRALRAHQAVVPLWVIHRHIGMGGDQLVAAVAGDDFERTHGDAVRDGWKAEFDAMIDEVAAVPGATELLAAVHDRGVRVVLASSGKPDHVERYVDQLGVRDLAEAWTSSDDVERTKPHPDLLAVALERVGGGRAVTFGDSTWDAEAAQRLKVPAVALRTGGFSADELSAAGAAAVYDSLDDVRADLDQVLGLTVSR